MLSKAFLLDEILRSTEWEHNGQIIYDANVRFSSHEPETGYMCVPLSALAAPEEISVVAPTPLRRAWTTLTIEGFKLSSLKFSMYIA